MNQEELRQQMVEALEGVLPYTHGYSSDSIVHKAKCEMIAVHLIRNGVTIREHGKWVKRAEGSEYECERCGRTPKMLFGYLPEFCPHCGADMRGGKDE